MRAAILSGNVDVDVVLVDSLAQRPGAVDGTGANVGDTWNGSVFVRPTFAAAVPAEVTMAQARIALARAGISEAAVDALIAALPSGAAKTETAIWWNRSDTVRRNSGNVAALAPSLGLDAAAVDALFIVAAGITP